MPATIAIQNLARQIAETCTRRVISAAKQPTGWRAVDRALGGLARGAVHEWFGLAEADTEPSSPPIAPPIPTHLSHWLPPLGLMVHLARQVALGTANPIVWIGRRVWPYPPVCGPDVLERSIFVDAADLSERAWAIDVSLRCPAIALVIGDGTALNMSATRRLQLAAAEGNALGLVLRPPRELRLLSAAQTRWSIAATPTPSASPRWILRLLRSKGLRLPDHTTWTLELNHETGALDLVSDAADRPESPEEIAGTATA